MKGPRPSINLDFGKAVHPLVEQTAKMFRGLDYDDDSQVPKAQGDFLTTLVHPNNIERALRIWNDVITAITAKGYLVRIAFCRKLENQPAKFVTRIEWGLDNIDVRIEQKQDHLLAKNDQWSLVLNQFSVDLYGVVAPLCFHIDNNVSTSQWRIWHDKPGLPLEAQIEKIVGGLERTLRLVKKHRLSRLNGGKYIELDKDGEILEPKEVVQTQKVEPEITYLTRKELYQLVWAKPTMSLAKDFGVSDVAVGKACDKYDIPKPPRGYWALSEKNRKPLWTPLPVYEEKHDPKIGFSVRPDRKLISENGVEWTKANEIYEKIKADRAEENRLREKERQIQEQKREERRQAELRQKQIRDEKEQAAARDRYVKKLERFVAAVESDAQRTGKPTGPGSMIGDWIAITNQILQTADLSECIKQEEELRRDNEDRWDTRGALVSELRQRSFWAGRSYWRGRD